MEPYGVSHLIERNHPPDDSLFDKVSEDCNRCSICGQVVWNNTESRDAHLNAAGCHVASPSY